MSREIKRVPEDFDYPLNRVWVGYLMPSTENLSDEWEMFFYENMRVDPPIGDCYQVWEDVSEGSPISPVFKTKEETIDWLVEQGYSREGAAVFIDRGWAPSFVMSSRGFQSGIDAAAWISNVESDEDDPVE